ncbi:MAG TPA: alpha/beta fold hydrolase [Terriglobales bacterium]|nr:alpha/beta fold hydrolase [Terriglobales bacterium]
MIRRRGSRAEKVTLQKRQQKRKKFGAIMMLCFMSTAVAMAQMPLPVKSATEAERRAAGIKDQHGVINSADGTCLFYRYWPATEPWNGHVVVVLHGIGFESGPYKVVADALNPRGVDVYGLDARGHGLSCGRRGYLGGAAKVAEDVGAIVAFAKQQRAAAKIFLVDDSMGCNYALDYAKQYQDQLSGVVLLGPVLAVNKKQIWRPSTLLLLPYLVFARRDPVVSLVGKRLDESSRDPQFVAERRTDPLAYKKVSFGYLLDVRRLVPEWKTGIAPVVRLPILMIAGGHDEVGSRKAFMEFERLSGSRDKQAQIVPGVYHTTLWDPRTPEILKVLGDWIVAR